MKEVHLLVLLGLLVPVPGVPHPFHSGAHGVGQGLRREDCVESVTRGNARDMQLQRKAEAALQRAAFLRRQQTRESLRAAIPRLQEAAHLFKAGHDSGRAADSYIGIGEVHSILGNYGQALASYEESLHLAAGDLPRSCRARSRLARIYASMGNSSAAQNSLQELENFCKGVPGTIAETSLAQGEILYFSGKLTQSAEHLKRARKLFANTDDREGEAEALLLLADATFESDQLIAVQSAEEALRLSSSSLNQQGIAKARKLLGVFTATLGRFEAAQCNSSVALKIFHNLGDRDREASVLNALGKVARETGDLQTSLKHYRQARVVFGRIQDRLGEAIAINGIAAALTPLHEYQLLRQLYKEELRTAEQAKNRLLIAFALMDLADVDRLQHQYQGAEGLYRRALATFESIDHHSGQGDVLLRLAYLEADQGRDSEAVSLLDRARVLKLGTGQLEDQAKIDYELAFLYRRMGRLEEALSAIKRTIDIIESQRLQIANFDSRAAYFAAVHQYYSLYIQVLMAVHRQHPDRGFDRLAFEGAEKSKVRSLLDLLTVSSQNSSCDQVLKSGLSANSDSAGNEGVTSTPEVLNLENIQAGIGDDATVLLEYALGDESSYLWAVRRKQIISYELPPAERLRTLARGFLAGLTPLQLRQGETVSGYSERIRRANRISALAGKELSRLLLGQLPLSPEERVLIVPDGFLQYIPFSALPLPQAGGPKAVLLTHHEAVALPSASALAALRMSAGRRAPPTAGIAILADPVFQPAQAGPTASAAHSAERKLPNSSPALNRALRDVHGSSDIEPLPASREEATAIGKIFGQEALVLLGYAANRQSVLNGLLAHHRVIHFATHGMLDVQHPEMSGLVLSLFNRQAKPQDGYLRLGDIYKLKLSADLVVLSSCESALGKEMESEGIIGLPRGFLHAGARSVIASLWKVDDDATAFLMAHLYQRIKQGQTVGAALRGAQLDMAKDRRYAQSNGWAAFVLLGDYGYRIEFKPAL